MDMQVSAEYPTHGYEQPGLENQDAQLYLASNILPRGKNYDGPMKIYDMLRKPKKRHRLVLPFLTITDQQKRSLGLLELLLVNH